MATVTSTKRHLDVTSDTYQSNGNVVIGGDLTVNGSTTTLDTQNLIVEDKNIIIGQVSTPSDTTADGGGITLKGATDKTIYWSNSDDEWKFNQGIEITSGIITVSGGTSTQWNTAYSWGDHSGLYAAASHTHAAGDITSGTLDSARIPSPTSGDWWNNGYVKVLTDGVMEVGKYFDMHATDTATSDYDVRLTASTGSLAISGDLVVSGGDITLSGTGRIQGIDTVSAGTDAANKTYVDNAVAAITETDTLDSVTDRGSTTTNSITTGNITANGSILGGGNLFLRSYNNDPKGIFFRDGFEYGDTNQYNLSITIYDDGDGAADGMMINAYDGVFFNVASGSTPATKFRVLSNEVKAFTNLISTGIVYASGGNSTQWNTAYGWGDHSAAGYLTGVTNISGYSGTLLREDNRTISPSELTSGRLKFGFTSWNNNNTSPYADFIHMRSYTDSSGGSDNLVMFKKNGIGMRLWQQTYGSATAYSSYADVWTSNDFTSTNVSNWNTAYSWGDHSGLYAAASHTHAASDITSGTFADARIALTNITQHTDPKYLRSNADDTTTGKITFAKAASGTLASRTGYSDFLGYNTNYGSYIGGGGGNTSKYLYAGGIFYDGTSHRTLWHNGNDGPGSGLDADTLDGNHASAFLTSYTETDTLATVTGRGSSTTTSCTFNTITMNTPVVGSSNKIRFANNDYIRYDDANGVGRFHFDADGGTNNASVQAATFVGALSTTGISGNNYNITGVNQLEINDPGEGIIWKAGSSGDITLAVVDDASDNILRLSGTGATLQVGTNRVLTTADEGSGNGLDADTLDGQHGSYYLPTTGTAANSQLLDNLDSTRFPYALNGTLGTTNTFVTDGGIGADNIARSMFYRDNGNQFGTIGFHAQHATSANYAWQMASTSYSNAGSIQARVKNNGTWSSPVTIWNSGNDGASSGLDADLLDGQQGSYYLAWGNLTGVPSTFTPSAHTLDSHSNVTITSNSSGEILKWNGSAWVNNTLAEAGIAAASHTHDDRYYTETESDNRFVNVTGDTMTGTLDVHVNDSGTILKSGNSSAVGTPDQFFIKHNLGNVEVGNNRGNINITNGNVGIGTTSPFTTGGTAKLTIAANSAISWGASNTDMSYFRRLSAGEFQWQTYNSGNTGEIHLQPYGGNVGIGTTSPSAKLSIDGGTDNLLATFKSTDDLAYISFQDNNTTSNTSVALGANDNNLVFFTGTSFGSERMRIDSSGNVGIGITSPDQTLHVFKGLAGSIASSNNAIITAENSQNGYLQLLVPSANESGILFGNPSNAAAGAIIYNNTTTSTGLQFRTNGNSTKMVIDGSGNVGIGTDSPGSELEVDGEITTTTITYPEPEAIDASAYNGEIVYFGSFESGIIGAGTLMSLGNDGSGNMRWYKADDNTTQRATGLLGIALGTSASAGLLVRGVAKNSAWSGFAAGDKLYLSPTDGAISNSITSDTNDFVRIIGYALGGNKIYFCPDNTYIQNA